MKKIKLFVILFMATVGMTSNLSATHLNQLSQEEKVSGWILLFDGQSTNGWRGFNQDAFPSNWQVVDGTLHVKSRSRLTESEQANKNDIVYDQQFTNFVLKLDWKVAKGGNSGIFYLAQEGKEIDRIWRASPEMQILDNIHHPDANKGKNGNRKAGSLYDLIPAKPQNAKAAGEWNQIEIIVNNRNVTHRQNGVQVVSYQLDTLEWQTLVSQSKFPALKKDWHKVAMSGFVGLQDHDDDVWFRNIKIRPL